MKKKIEKTGKNIHLVALSSGLCMSDIAFYFLLTGLIVFMFLMANTLYLGRNNLELLKFMILADIISMSVATFYLFFAYNKSCGEGVLFFFVLLGTIAAESVILLALAVAIKNNFSAEKISSSLRTMPILFFANQNPEIMKTDSLFSRSILMDDLFFMIKVCLTLSLILVVLTAFLSKRRALPQNDKLSPYECGFQSIGDNIITNLQFIRVIIVFVAFDIEIVLLYPLAKDITNFPLVVNFLYVTMLIIIIYGFLYEAKAGSLDWGTHRSKESSVQGFFWKQRNQINKYLLPNSNMLTIAAVSSVIIFIHYKWVY